MSGNVLGEAAYIARKDVRILFRSWETWLWTFLMPVAFFYFIGTMTRGMGGSPGGGGEVLPVVIPSDAGFLADALVRRLEGLNYDVRKVDPAERHSRVLIVPQEFTASVIARKPARVELRRTSGGQAGTYDEIRLKRALYGMVADLFVLENEGRSATAEELAKREAIDRNVKVKTEMAGKRVIPPKGFDQSVPGTMVMFTLLMMFTTGGVTLLNERDLGILRRLASAPISRGAVVLGKWGARMALGVIQIGFAMLTGAVLFDVAWGPNLGAVSAVLLAYAGLAASLGMLLGNFGRSHGQVIGLGVIASNVMAALGGCWWPIEVTPQWTQKLALALPTGWTMDALHKLVSFGEPAAAVLPHIAVLSVAAVLAGYAVSRWFRFQ